MILCAHFMDVLLLALLNVVSLGDYTVAWVQKGPVFLLSKSLLVHHGALILFTNYDTLVLPLHTAYRQTVLTNILQQIASW